MTHPTLSVLVVGATGSIGRHVVDEALAQGHSVKAFTRNPKRASLPEAVEVVRGDLTDPATLEEAVKDVDAVVFAHGTHGTPPTSFETVDYGGVHNVLETLNGRRVRISLMTSIGVTYRAGSYNRSTGAHDWKRRAERLVRASGNDYTIVRPGWFDYNDANQEQLVFLQGDTRRAGSPADGVVSRRQIGQVLVSALTSETANHKTLELVAERGGAQTDLNSLFATLDADDRIDGVRDEANMPLADEPASVREAIKKVEGQA